MNEHYIVTIDRGHLRIFVEASSSGQRIPRLEVVEAIDFPNYARSNDERSDGDVENVSPVGSSVADDQRPGQKRRRDRRNTDMLAAELNTFLQNRPTASWDFAAAPSLYRSIMEQLSPETRRRLKRVLSKTLVDQRAEEVRAHFVTAGR